MRIARRVRKRIVLGMLVPIAFAITGARAEAVRIVAAESVYGDIARQIGGAEVSVASILANPDQDPHEFEAAVATARAIAQACIVIYNGAGYDSWMARLLSVSKSSSPVVIEVARLARRQGTDNPHLWYDIEAMSALAATLAEKLGEIDPVRRSDDRARAAAFETSLQPLRARIAAMRARYAGTKVTATEPVFQYMADALGLTTRNERFQLAVMNGTEPGARTIAAFEDDLRARVVKVLVFNTQSGEALAERMRAVAGRAGVPVVPISETAPPGMSYQQWMTSQLDALEKALAQP
jgi:zinc/manganese transport system substrate-binding protein